MWTIERCILTYTEFWYGHVTSSFLVLFLVRNRDKSYDVLQHRIYIHTGATTGTKVRLSCISGQRRLLTNCVSP